MAIIQGNAKQGSTRGFYPKTLAGSLRFNDDDSAYLSWTPASAGNRKTWTWSGWVKRGNISLGSDVVLFCAGVDDANKTLIRINTSDQLRYVHFDTASATDDVVTTQVFRDPSAWYHIVVAVDTTDGTASNRVKMYVNGEQVTSFATSNYPTSSFDTDINTTNGHFLGKNVTTLQQFDGYLAEVHFTDGTAYTADDFGELKNGVWVAKDPSVTYGTNGFYLNFQDDTAVEAFNTVLYRGNGGIQSVTGTGFAPDLVWIKERNGTDHHRLQDTVRGAGYRLYSSTTSAEGYASDSITSFDSDGFTVGSSLAVNESGNSYVAWCWKAGDSNVSNTDGSITSTVRANQTYGFSVVSYTGVGAGSAANEIQVGHGLGEAPKLVFVKNRSATGDWFVFTTAIDGSNDYLYLNQTAAKGDSGNSVPTSSYINLGGSLNTSGNNYIAYCWAEKAGYSKFDSYLGDGTTDGSLEITTGFKPSFVLFKKSSGISNWNIVDDTRDVAYTGDNVLFANEAYYEGQIITDKPIEFTATGFKIRNNEGGFNTNGETYIYAAFADTREAAFWLDQSGNDNDWQPVNLDHNDTVLDSPTDNFCTFNPLHKDSSITLSDGNLKAIADGTGNWCDCGTNFAFNSGQWYAEFTMVSTGSSAVAVVDVSSSKVGDATSGANIFTDPNSVLYRNNGDKWIDGVSGGAYGSTYTNGDVIGVAVDADSGSVTFYKNGTSQGTLTSVLNTGITYMLAIASSSSSGFVANFGQQPFKYDPPA